jgi:hypothetical protein
VSVFRGRDRTGCALAFLRGRRALGRSLKEPQRGPRSEKYVLLRLVLRPRADVAGGELPNFPAQGENLLKEILHEDEL